MQREERTALALRAEPRARRRSPDEPGRAHAPARHVAEQLRRAGGGAADAAGRRAGGGERLARRHHPRRGRAGRGPVGGRARPAGGAGHRHAARRAHALRCRCERRAGAIGVVALRAAGRGSALTAEQRALLEALSPPGRLALERVRLAEEAEAAALRARPRRCAARSSRRSRTTCARRSPPSPARPPRCGTHRPSSPTAAAHASCSRRSATRPSASSGWWATCST